MSLQFYKPNKLNKGYACSFNYSIKDNIVYSQILKQISWDEEKRIGKFKDDTNNSDNKISIKLGESEIAGIINSIENNIDFSTYHTSKLGDEQTSKSICFKKWFSKTEPEKQTGYSFSITLEDRTDKTQNNSFYVGLKPNEAQLLKQYLVWCLNQIFTQESKNFTDNKLIE